MAKILDLTSLEKAINSLERAITVYEATKMKNGYDVPDLLETLRAGVIQNFEFVYELSWKFMKRYIDVAGDAAAIDGVPRRELFRVAAEHGLIMDVSAWFDFHKDRNQTSHTYDEETAEMVYQQSVDFLNYAQILLSELKVRTS